MNATSVTLVLEQLETALTIAHTLVAADEASSCPDARLVELMTTLTVIEQEIRQMQQAPVWRK